MAELTCFGVDELRLNDCFWLYHVSGGAKVSKASVKAGGIEMPSQGTFFFMMLNKIATFL